MNDFPMRKMNSSDEDILDISHAGGSGSAVMGSDEAINAPEGRPRDEILGGGQTVSDKSMKKIPATIRS